ncbi:Uncharacterised protein [Burkholderia pseudomallei]|nr:Uncharacterised protein [Burkholderia pseudomallei]
MYAPVPRPKNAASSHARAPWARRAAGRTCAGRAVARVASGHSSAAAAAGSAQPASAQVQPIACAANGVATLANTAPPMIDVE